MAAFATLDQRVFSRVASGRPFLLSAALLALLCLLRLGREREPSVRGVIVLAPLFRARGVDAPERGHLRPRPFAHPVVVLVLGGWAAERPYAAMTAVEAGPALPDAGGILCMDDMRLFFHLFYSRPQAPFCYIVGYEPALMPPSDLATLRAIGAAKTGESFLPRVAKMTPRDRLIVQSLDGQPPIPGLQWTQVSRAVWSGRVRPPGAP